jgi:hypothetical protein
MKPELMAFYAGPDQIMGLASGLAGLLGLLMMFWNKVMGFLGRIANRIKPAVEDTDPPQSA